MRNALVVLHHDRPIVLLLTHSPLSYRVRRLRAEIVRYIRVLRHHDASSAKPGSEGDLHVLAAPNVQRRVHLPLLPPVLRDRKHAHRDGRVVVVVRTAAPELTKRVLDGRRTRALKLSE